MNYKKIFTNQENRFKILDILKFIPNNLMVKVQYYLKLYRLPNIKKPKRFTEKIQWYKLNYKNSLMTNAADKYNVREYVAEKNLENLLVRLYGVYDKPGDIKFEELPEKFVIKTTNGSGTNILCTDKKLLDINKVESTLNTWLKRNYYAAGREWAYKGIKPKIIIEEYLEDEKIQHGGINDYKFLCYNGKPEYIILDVDRNIGHKRNIYDVDWNYLEVNSDKDSLGDVIDPPEELKKMTKIAEKLSEDFPFVRVDLYYVNNKIYFGELTFYPWTGYVQFTPDEFDFELGKKMSFPVGLSTNKKK